MTQTHCLVAFWGCLLMGKGQSTPVFVTWTIMALIYGYFYWKARRP